MSGKYKQIPIGAHRIKIKEQCFEKEEFLEADNNLNLTGLFMRDYGSLEKNLEEAKRKIFKKGFGEPYNLKQSKNKVYWDVEKMRCTLKPMFTQVENIIFIEIKKYDKGMSCFTCKYHLEKNGKSYCEDAFGFEVNPIKTMKCELYAEDEE